MCYKKYFYSLLWLAFLYTTAHSQDPKKNIFGQGIRVLAADSSFSMKFSIRIQSLYDGIMNLENEDYTDGFQIRRSRLKFDGFAYHPKLEYKIELAVSNSDIASGSIPQSGDVSNIVLDAYVKWNFWRNWSLLFGQAKLPGNRERVISSQELQFVDRSNLNAEFNIDRDAGIQLHYNGKNVNLISAFTMGEGRNMIVNNAGGHAYTFRGEYLPFGQFLDEGDYFGSDLSREPTPKLSFAVTYDFNDGASRSGGQLGDFLPVMRDLRTWFADVHFKYRGLSSFIEYANKVAPEGPVLSDAEGNFEHAFNTGEGINCQVGYLFKSNFEVAGRYTHTTPDQGTMRNQNTQYTLGFSRYFVGHNLKVQSDITFIEENTVDDKLMYRLQVELAF